MRFATNETALKRPGAAYRRACRARLACVEAAGGAVCSRPSRITCLIWPQQSLCMCCQTHSWRWLRRKGLTPGSRL